MSTKIFVYGTLLKGMERAVVLKESLYLGPAMAQANLYDMGAYPGIKQGSGIIVGELYNISEDVLNTLDQIEGYFPADLSSSLFIRKTILVKNLANGHEIEALTYFYNHEPNESMLISHGDYRRYVLEGENDSHWIVSYGSNMNLARLCERVGQIGSCKKGFLRKFKLIFNKQASKKQATYANVAYTGWEDCCPIIATKLSTHQISKLDIFEGVPNHYLRISR